MSFTRVDQYDVLCFFMLFVGLWWCLFELETVWQARLQHKRLPKYLLKQQEERRVADVRWKERVENLQATLDEIEATLRERREAVAAAEELRREAEKQQKLELEEEKRKLGDVIRARIEKEFAIASAAQERREAERNDKLVADMSQLHNIIEQLRTEEAAAGQALNKAHNAFEEQVDTLQSVVKRANASNAILRNENEDLRMKLATAERQLMEQAQKTLVANERIAGLEEEAERAWNYAQELDDRGKNLQRRLNQKAAEDAARTPPRTVISPDSLSDKVAQALPVVVSHGKALESAMGHEVAINKDLYELIQLGIGKAIVEAGATKCVIGEGTTGKVCLWVKPNGNVPLANVCAVKMLKDNFTEAEMANPTELCLTDDFHDWDNHQAQSFEKEGKLLLEFDHDNIIKVFGFAHDEHNIRRVMLMERLAGDAFQLMLQDGGQYSPARGFQFLKQLACGLSYLHSQGIAHYDLKPTNCGYRYVDRVVGTTRVSMPRFVLFDLNMAKRIGDANDTGGTRLYRAPEIVNAHEVATVCDGKSDVWALFVCVVHLCGFRGLSEDDETEHGFNITDFGARDDGHKMRDWHGMRAEDTRDRSSAEDAVRLCEIIETLPEEFHRLWPDNREDRNEALDQLAREFGTVVGRETDGHDEAPGNKGNVSQ